MYAIQEWVFPSMPLVIQKPLYKIKHMLMWNAVLRAGIEAYLGVAMGCMMSLSKPSLASKEAILNLVMSFFMLLYLFGYPCFIIWFLKKNRF